MNVNHPLLGVIAHNIEVEYSPVIFTQSPVFDAYEGTTQRVGFDVDNDETPTFGGSLATTQSGLELSFEQPGTTGEHVLSYETVSVVGNLSLYVVSRTYLTPQCRVTT